MFRPTERATTLAAPDFPHPFVIVASLTLIVLLRKRVGYRLMHSWWLFLGIAVLIVFPYVVGNFFTGTMRAYFAPDNPACALFAMAVAGRAWYLRKQHLDDIHDLGTRESWHTRDPGASAYGFETDPDAYLHRFGEPVACFLVGLVVKQFISWPLGVWILVASVCLALFERFVHRQALHRKLNIVDTLAEGRLHGEWADRFSRQGRAGPTMDAANDGIPAGSDDELIRRAERRRRDRPSPNSAD
jgi:hypothetical protein